MEAITNILTDNGRNKTPLLLVLFQSKALQLKDKTIKEHIHVVECKLYDSVHRLNRRDAVLQCIQLRWCLISKKIINAFLSIKI
jgi:hypothetical protein